MSDEKAFMVSLSNHEGTRAMFGARRFMVRQAHHEALLQRAISPRRREDQG